MIPATGFQPPAWLLAPRRWYFWPLWPLSLLYRFGNSLDRRRKKPRATAGIRVVSIGNLSAGGSGKTPAAIWLAERLARAGVPVAVLSRGYRADEAKDSIPMPVYNQLSRVYRPVGETGDEPWLIARRLAGLGVAVYTGRDRVALAAAAAAAGYRLALADDAFQHYRLARDLDIVLLDAEYPFDNGALLPAGRLREPPARLLDADAIILTRSERVSAERLAATEAWLSGAYPRARVFRAEHRALGLRPFPSLSGQTPVGITPPAPHTPLWALSGIARPDTFAGTLRALGYTIRRELRFRDHARYSVRQARSWFEALPATEAVVTTEKDMVKLIALTESLPPRWREWPNFWYLVLEWYLRDAERFDQSILKKVLPDFHGGV